MKKKILAAIAAMSMMATMSVSALAASAACVKDTSDNCYGKVTLYYQNASGVWVEMPHGDDFIASAVYNGDTSDTMTIILQSYAMPYGSYTVWGYIDDVRNSAGVSIVEDATFNEEDEDENGYTYQSISIDPENSLNSNDSDFGTYYADVVVTGIPGHPGGGEMTVKFVISECDCEDCNC